ncbi:MAG: hypothetical protein FGM46_07520 [Ferruginibacter sp.]|nr:hypothetical protein [Ferruginibacter sp.]
MNNIDLMNALALASKSKKNKDLVIYMGIVLAVISVSCLLALKAKKKLKIENQQLHNQNQNKQNQLLAMSGQLSSAKNEQKKIQNEYDLLLHKYNQITVFSEKERPADSQEGLG